MEYIHLRRKNQLDFMVSVQRFRNLVKTLYSKEELDLIVVAYNAKFINKKVFINQYKAIEYHYDVVQKIFIKICSIFKFMSRDIKQWFTEQFICINQDCKDVPEYEDIIVFLLCGVYSNKKVK